MRLFLIVVLQCLVMSLFSQLSGTITDEKGEPLPYVSIYIKGTTTGTTSNMEGNYELKFEPGEYQIVFQYIGYGSKQNSITVRDKEIVLNIELTPEATLLNEVVIAADAEDPAYAIIRQAIKKRPYYLHLLESYTCDAYVKGNTKVLDAPEKILGVEVGDFDGALDSNRQGIVYLSESVSKLYVHDGNIKEVVTSSKVSGDDNGYSWNSAREMEFSFYQNSFELERQMLSPIADVALNYYRYRLIGTYYDDEHRLINKIEVTPKRNTDPCFYGTIYIVEDLWNIHSLDLGVTAKASQIYVLDSLTFKQVYLPLDKTIDKWALFNNSISFKLGMFGFKMRGVFSCVYNDYNISPKFEEDFFDNVILEVTEESNERDSNYWASIRPIPLTDEEVVDYVIKDSIQVVRKDPIHLDSMDQKNNQFGLGDLIGEYRYTKRSKQFYYVIESPITNTSFNTVQGLNSTVKFRARKYLDKEETKGIYWGGAASYGFSEKTLRGNGYITFDPSGQNWNWWHLRGGSRIRQYNNEVIGDFLNMAYSLLLKKNHAKFYDEKYIDLIQRVEVVPGVFLRNTLSYSDRSTLDNNTDYSFFSKDQTYFTNHPDKTSAAATLFGPHQAVKLSVTADIRFGQQYIKRPDFRFNAGSKGPRLSLNYTGAFKILGGDVSYQKLAASIRDTWDIGVGGRLDWYFNMGSFFAKDKMEFVDFRHFNTYEIFFTGGADYRTSFLQLPYYTYSTSDTYFQSHFQHHFDGWILDKLPGINQLGWSLVAGAKFLKTKDLPSYSEFHLGIDNIGFSFVRLLRVDAVMSLTEGKTNWGARLSLAFD